ncbi:unnamed protein product [Rhizophagus irregularis]|uniref:F-box domain-containing protein n=1 Tax=Rhizophagus irregularis TaxID=588596 RepID=A0A915ZJ48_9GLOM|nr:unnamed protein product [Rhizophagus irregularis]GBC11470.1 hypothetical protein GLOIN_2v1684574 [Rhizophagus irregularis DAOM 181602=DAOM 197198]CAB4464449.1 unnamed protein product [Rhizophagus irregularis]CAB5096587.1 unnamed protein product [Rhizophagus irregularis]CAB5364422.1 unnamed protein product [Rhizophagus irregularis]
MCDKLPNEILIKILTEVLQDMSYEKFINLRYVNNKWKLLVSVVINDEFSQKLKKDFEFMNHQVRTDNKLNIKSTYYDPKDGKFSFEISPSPSSPSSYSPLPSSTIIHSSLNAQSELSLEYLCKGRVIYWRLPTSHYYNAHEERNDECWKVKKIFGNLLKEEMLVLLEC